MHICTVNPSQGTRATRSQSPRDNPSRSGSNLKANIRVQPGNQRDKELVPKGQPKPLWFQPEGYIQVLTNVLLKLEFEQHVKATADWTR